MKNRLLLFTLILFLIFRIDTYAQVGINSDNSQPDPSAMLDVKSGNRGVLIPRIALVSADNPAPLNTPLVPGLLVYNTVFSGYAANAVVPGFYYWNGLKWFPWSMPQGSAPGDMLIWSGSSWVILPPGLNQQELIFCDGYPVWGGCLALLVTMPVTEITVSGAKSGGNITNTGGTGITTRGVCWSRNPGPTILDSTTINGTGSGQFLSLLTGLQANTQYYLRAYAINGKGVSYGNEFSFRTTTNINAPKSIIRELLSCPATPVTIPVITKNFQNVGGFHLTIGYNPAKLHLTGVTNSAGFPGFSYTSANGRIFLNGHSASSGITLADSSVLFSMNFQYDGDSIPVQWITANDSSIYYQYPDYTPMNQQPVSLYYFNGGMKAKASIPVSITISASKTSVCTGTQVSFTSSIVNGGTAPAYQWKVNGSPVQGSTASTYSYTPVNGDVVTCALTSNVICPSANPAISNAVSLTVSPILPVSVVNTASALTVCSGTPVTFTATPTNGGTAPTYQWKVNTVNVGGATNQTYTYNPLNGQSVTCLMTSNAQCISGNPATSNNAFMHVNANSPVSISITASSNTVCAGTQITMTATPTNGGTIPGYQWKVNGTAVSGATNSTYSFAPAATGTVTCMLTSSLQCTTGNPATSNTVNITVNPVAPVSLTISATSTAVCAGTQVTYTASPVNGGTTPAYQWKVNGSNVQGSTGSTYSYIPANGDAVSCVLTSNATCATGNPATSNAITMTVHPVLPVSVTVSASNTTVCAGTQVTFTATGINGGSSPVFDWKVNGVSVQGSNVQGSNFTYTPLNGDVVSCLLTSNATCPSGSPATSNSIIMTVHPLLPVSVTISAGSTTVCAGTQVTFSATGINGGSLPVYEWKVNGQIVQGSNVQGSNFAYTPVNGDVVSCMLTSNETCATGSPAASNTIAMTVHPLLPVSVTISAGSTTVCAGTEVTFAATGVNGGSSPVYEWKVNGQIVQGSSIQGSNFAYTPVNGDVVSCMLTSNETCATGSPATSNTINMTVHPQLPVSVTIFANSTTVCAGTQVTFTATGINGGSSPVYQWKVNGMEVQGSSVQGSMFVYAPVNGDAITCVLISDATCATGSPATSNTIAMTVHPLLPVSVTITASNTTVCAGTQVTFTATGVNGGNTPVYEWKVNGQIIQGSNVQGSNFIYTPLNGDVVSCLLTSNETCGTGSPAASNTISMTVHQLLPVSVTISAGSTTVCAGTEVTLTATEVNGGSSPVYQWKVNGQIVQGSSVQGSNFAYTPVNGDVVSCVLTSNETCTTGNPATSNAIDITVHPLLPVSVTISATNTTVCAGTEVTFTATGINGGSSPVYKWKVNGVEVQGSNVQGSNFAYTPVNGDAVTCMLFSDATCETGSPAVSNTISMTVYQTQPAGVTITASGNNICTGTQVTYSATPTNGGTIPGYQWKVNGTDVPGATSSEYIFIPVNNDAVSCVMNSSAFCISGNPASSNIITMSVGSQFVAGVTISASSNSVCSGSLASFQASPSNGGLTPEYQWNINGNPVSGATNSYFSYAPVNGDAVTCVMTTNAPCVSGSPATSNTINMTVTTVVPVSVKISSSSNSVCTGTLVNFIATPTNGGVSPAYQWKKGETNITGATNSTFSYLPASGDAISCVLNSSLQCTTGNPATSSPITIIVNPIVPVNVVISASGNNVCTGSSVNLIASPTNGGTVPAYQWRVNGQNKPGATASTYSYVPANGDAVTCMLTSNLQCTTGNPATSNGINMTVTVPSVVGVSISTNSNNVCAGSAASFIATPANGGISPVYQWKVNGTSVSGATGSAFSYTPVNNDAVTCILTSDANCVSGNPATSNSIAMTVTPLSPVSVSIAAGMNPVCAGVQVTYAATGVNGGSVPGYQWKVNGTSVQGATGSSYAYTPVNGDVVSCMLTSGLTCTSGNPAASNLISMTVNPLLVAGISITPSSNPVCLSTPVSFSSSIVNGGNSPAYQWQKNGLDITGATNSTYSFTPVDNEIIRCILTSNAVCVTGNPVVSNGVNMTVNPGLPVSVVASASANPVCDGSHVTVTATPTNGGNSPAYQWVVNGITVSGATNQSYNYIPVNNDAVKCIMTSSLACVVGNPVSSNTVTMIVNPVQPVSVSISVTSNKVCAGTQVGFLATAANGGNIPAYQWKVNGNNVQGATNSTYTYTPANGDVVTCSLTSNIACASGNPAISNQVILTVNPILPVSLSVAASSNTVCAGTSVTFTGSPANGGTAPTYQWKVNTAAITGATNSNFAYTPVNGDAVSCVLTSNASCTTGNPASSNTVTMTVNPNVPVSVTVSAPVSTVCAGTQVSFTANAINAGTFPQYAWSVNGNAVSGATNSTWSYIPQNGDAISCIVTSSLACATGSPATSNPVFMTVKPMLPVSLTISTETMTICAGTQVAFTATPVNGGTLPVYQWKVNGVDVQGSNVQGSLFTYAPANGDVVSCMLTSSEGCTTGNPAISNAVSMTVHPLLPVGVVVTASENPVCAGTHVNFTAVPTNGGSSSSYQWKVNETAVPGATGSAYGFTPANGDAVSCVLNSNALCAAGNPASSVAVVMTVHPLLPAGIAIFPSANPVCPGTSVTFESNIVNGGNSPAYQWVKNSQVISGATAQSYNFTPSGGEAISCVMTSNLTCVSGNPATSGVVNMSVIPSMQVGVSVAASSNPVCHGTSVTYTATPVNGGATPFFQWNVNGNNVSGATNQSYIYVPANNDVVKCEMTSSFACATGNPGISSPLTMIVNPVLPVSVTISSSSNSVCTGTVINFIATTVNGGLPPGYQWRVNGTAVSGATNQTYSYVPVNGDAVTCVVNSTITCPGGNPATSNIIHITVNPQLPVSVTISSTSNNVCSGTQVNFIASGINGGTVPAYQWKVNGSAVSGATTAAFGYVPVHGDVVTCALTSNALCATGNPATSNPVAITVNPLLPVSVAISAGNNPVCAGTQVTCQATPVNGGAAPAYQWKVNGSTIQGATNQAYSYIPAENDQVSCVLTSNAACVTGNPANSNLVTMQVNPRLPVSVTISSTSNNVCAGTQVSFIATPANGGSSPAFQWKVNGSAVQGATASTYNYIPAGGDAVTCMLTSSAVCISGNPATSNSIDMTVNPLLPVSLSISVTSSNVCAGSPVTFTANTVNGGNTPAYQWKVNGQSVQGSGGQGANFTYTPLNGDVVTCILTSSAACISGNPAISNSIAMTVNPLLPVSITISASGNNICAGSQVAFTASLVNGGTSPVYQWRVNEQIVQGSNVQGSNVQGSNFAYTPLNGDVVSCLLTSSETCTTGSPAISNNELMTVTPLLPVSVAVSSNVNGVCAGTQVEFLATPTNGGTSPVYEWKVNGTAIPGHSGSTYTYVPANGDVVSCILTSSETCTTGNPAISNVVTAMVNPLLPVSLTIGATANVVCAGTSVSFTAIPVNGGTTPLYQWKLNGSPVSGATAPGYTFVPVHGDVITCSLISSEPCAIGNPATSNPIALTVNPLLPVSLMISASGNNICAGSQVTFTASPVNGGTSPAYQWKVNGQSVQGSGVQGSDFTYTPLNGDVVSCVLTSNATCATGSPAASNTINMTVHPLLPVSVTATPGVNPVCAGTSVTYLAVPTNGGTNPQYQWNVKGVMISGATNAIFTYVPANGDNITCHLASNAVCATGSPATSNAVNMIVNPLLPVSVVIAANNNPVCAGTIVSFTSNAVNGGNTPSYQWIVNGTAVTGATGAGYSYTPLNGDVVSCRFTSSAGCTTGNPAISNSVVMTVNALLPVGVSISASANPVCAGTKVTNTATPVNGGSAPAYQWLVNGSVISGATSATYLNIPANGDVIACRLTSNGTCITGNPATSNSLAMTVNPLMPVSVAISSTASVVCAGTQVTCTAVPVNGGSAPVYQWKLNGVNVSGATTPTYSFVPVNLNAVSCVLTSNVTCGTGSPATSNTLNFTVNPLLPVSLTVAASATTVCAGTQVTFTATPVNGGSLPVYQWKINGTAITGAIGSTYSYVPVNADAITCTLTSNATCATGSPATSNSIIMTVNPLLPVSLSISATNTTVCAGTSVICTAVPVNGGANPVYQWKLNGSNVTGATTSTYTLIPVNGNTVSCVLTSNAVCATGSPATSNVLSFTVNPILPVSITIAASATTVCAGTSVTFTATPVNGGTLPAYQWVVNGTNVTAATNATYTYAPAMGDAVKCVLISNATCTSGSPATSNVITITTIPVTAVSSAITASAYAVMPNTTVVYTATSVNGGSSPTYQWKLNNVVVGTNSSTYTHVPANNDNVVCIVTTSLTGCLSNNPAASNIVNMIVYTTGTPCTGTPTVVYGGMTYNTIQVGTQCWMRENMNVGTRVDGSVTQTNNSVIEKYCYSNSELNCNVYGGLYQWAEMVQYYNGVTNSTHWSPLPTGNVQGICPAGWHVPTNDEATVMMTFLGGTTSGGAMKEAGTTHWKSPNVGATNSYGFTALPAGYSYNGASGNILQYGNIWTITKGQLVSDAYYFGAAFNYSTPTNQQSYKTTGYSVRCLKN